MASSLLIRKILVFAVVIFIALSHLDVVPIIYC